MGLVIGKKQGKNIRFGDNRHTLVPAVHERERYIMMDSCHRNSMV